MLLLFSIICIYAMLLFRVCWPLEWSLNPCQLHYPCLQSLDCTQSHWSVSHAQLETSLSTVSYSAVPAQWSQIIAIILNLSLTQGIVHRCLALPVSACWRPWLESRLAAAWLKSFPRSRVFNWAHLYHGQNPPENSFYPCCWCCRRGFNRHQCKWSQAQFNCKRYKCPSDA